MDETSKLLMDACFIYAFERYCKSVLVAEVTAGKYAKYKNENRLTPTVNIHDLSVIEPNSLLGYLEQLLSIN